MHQSGRVAIMLRMRSWPQAGNQRVAAIASSACCAQRRLALVEGDEPLLGGAEDDRVLAAPADRVGVDVLAGLDERARLAQELDRSSGWRRRRCSPAKRSTSGRKRPRLVHRAVDVEPVADAGQVVVLAVAGRGVHEAGAGVEGDVVGEHARRVAVDPGMAEAHASRARRPSVTRAARPGVRPTRFCALTALSAFASSSTSRVPSTGKNAYSALGVEREREVGGQRPGRRRPDDRGHLLARPGPDAGPRARASSSAPARTARRSDGLSWCSSYSTSASASAVRHEMHQCTDFLAL